MPYVEKTAISFKTLQPSYEDFVARITNTLKLYPYLVLCVNGNSVGYAYAGPFHSRSAYAWSCETSIYLRDTFCKMGLGRMLYQALEDKLRAQGILNMCACISVTDQPDPYVNNNSYEFHQHLGFRLVGRFLKSGQKFGRWYDIVWMEKSLGEHKRNTRSIRPFSELDFKYDAYGCHLAATERDRIPNRTD